MVQVYTPGTGNVTELGLLMMTVLAIMYKHKFARRLLVQVRFGNESEPNIKSLRNTNK